MLKRTIRKQIERALEISPAVLLAGARQVGKTTTVMTFDREYIVMDDITQLEAATVDPQGFIERSKKPLTIDEIQKAPQLLSPVKLFIDKNRVNGDFLLTGSANILNLKNSEESLAGRLIELTMYPFTAKEKNQDIYTNVVDMLFDKKLTDIELANSNYGQLDKYVLEGGYPLAFMMTSAKDRFLWFNSYISSYIERDIRTIGELRDIDNFIRFFNVISARPASLLNKSSLANETKLNHRTVENYISLLEKVYQINLLRPYHENISKTFIKSPKMYLTDSGIASHLLGISTIDDLENSRYKGQIYETFVFAELLKHINYSQSILEFFYYRTRDHKEIDFIIKKQNRILAIELKTTHSVSKRDFRQIIDFQKISQHDVLGIVLYQGEKIVGFGNKLFALPLTIFL